MTLLLFASLVALVLFGVSPWLKPPKKGGKRTARFRPKTPTLLKREDKSLVRQMALLNLDKKRLHIWDIATMSAFTLAELMLTGNVVAGLLYAVVGKNVFRVFLTFRAAKIEGLQQAQVQQFVRGVADYLETGDNMIGAVTSSTRQLRQPMRDIMTIAINNAKGNITLPDSIGALVQKLQNDIFNLIGKLIGKGLEEGQSEIAFAFRQLDWRLKEGERVNLQRAAIISGYLLWVGILLSIGSVTTLLEKFFYPDVWQEVLKRPWITIAGAVVDIILAAGLLKYARLYTQRGDLS